MRMERKTTYGIQFTDEEHKALETVCSIMNSIFWESCDHNGNEFDLISTDSGCVLATHGQICDTLDVLNTLCALHEENKGFGFNVEYR